MTHEEVLDEVNVIYERISNYEQYEDKNNLFSGRNYTEALEILIDYYEVGFIEELEKIREEMEELINFNESLNGNTDIYEALDIINEHIKELKGENNGIKN